MNMLSMCCTTIIPKVVLTKRFLMQLESVSPNMEIFLTYKILIAPQYCHITNFANNLQIDLISNTFLYQRLKLEKDFYQILHNIWC